MDILLVNDDGIHAPGLRLLAEALRGAGHSLTVVAPDRERSAVGHGITTRDPLFVQEVPWEGIPAYSCSGTPADCTQLGLKALAPKPVDLVVSGPNNGINTAGDLLYSGTVAAAMEGAKLGVKAIALSAPAEADKPTVVQVFLKLLAQLDLEADVRQVLNINVPARPWEEIQGVRWAPPGGLHLAGRVRGTGEPQRQAVLLVHLRRLFPGRRGRRPLPAGKGLRHLDAPHL